MVIRAEMLRDLSGIGGVIELGLIESKRKCLDLLTIVFL